ncbi:dihydrofolate reductase family protein [Streptomyces daliensis]|uniref:Dihydrofolate reductase family protein n=1 Tax=Streptomyces daliensis TaxID=299421 RepID=A0A8T4IXE9_9ACTN|nr:dihydrofolate reductase family protein [Streptomyces daliensis]
MGRVFSSMSMSLDGFIAAPHDTADLRATGAVVMGRRSYDLCRSEGGRCYGGPLRATPCFVLTRESPEPTTATTATASEAAGASGPSGACAESGSGSGAFTFVTDGLERAVERARAAAGDGRIGLLGGTVVQQCLRAGLLDEIQIHLVPVLLGGGLRLFDHLGTRKVELERTRVIESPGVKHLRFAVVR